MEIINKTALVTGGANGIGFGYVQELLRNGAKRVAILDLANSNGDGSVAKLEAEFGKGSAIFIPCDVTKPQELEVAFEKTVKNFEGLDIVINNAGIGDERHWELEISVNLNAVVRGTMLGLDYMGKHKGGKGGTIVNIASILGLFPFRDMPVYSATKHAVVALSRAFSKHYEESDVRILVLCPGQTDTTMVTTLRGKMFSLNADGAETKKQQILFNYSQTVANVTSAMIQIIKSAENGSIWVSEDDKPVYEVKIPGYQDMKVVA